MLLGKWLMILIVTNTLAVIALLILDRSPLDILLFAGLLLLIISAAFVSTFTHWWVNTDILTTDKLICVRYHGLFRFSVDELALEDIRAIDIRQDGILQNLFGYGNVELSSELTGNPKIMLKNICNVDRLSRLLRQNTRTHSIVS